MKHILAWSRGKDSTASGILAKVEGWPLDGIITVCPDPFSGESKFIERFENFMEMPVEIISGPRFEDFFFRVKVRGRNAAVSADITARCKRYDWCNSNAIIQ